jgi:hypothetical protein
MPGSTNNSNLLERVLSRTYGGLVLSGRVGWFELRKGSIKEGLPLLADMLRALCSMLNADRRAALEYRQKQSSAIVLRLDGFLKGADALQEFW